MVKAKNLNLDGNLANDGKEILAPCGEPNPARASERGGKYVCNHHRGLRSSTRVVIQPNEESGFPGISPKELVESSLARQSKQKNQT